MPMEREEPVTNWGDLVNTLRALADLGYDIPNIPIYWEHLDGDKVQLWRHQRDGRYFIKIVRS